MINLIKRIMRLSLFSLLGLAMVSCVSIGVQGENTFNDTVFGTYRWGEKLTDSKNLEINYDRIANRTTCKVKSKRRFLGVNVDSLVCLMNFKKQFEAVDIRVIGRNKCEMMRNKLVQLLRDEFSFDKNQNEFSNTWNISKLQITMHFSPDTFIKDNKKGFWMGISIKHNDYPLPRILLARLVSAKKANTE